MRIEWHTDAHLVIQFSFRTRSNSRSMSRARTISRAQSIEAIERPEVPLTTRQTAALALVFCGLWCAANVEVSTLSKD